MDSTDRVWMFMQQYQHEHEKPPTLDEVRGGVEGLTYRSSVRYTLEHLVREGRVREEGEAGSARRYRAVGREGTDLVTELPGLTCHFVRAETLETR